MNKLELLIRENHVGGECLLNDVMTGDPNSRNVSSTVRAMLENARTCPWVIIDGGLYWIQLRRMPGKTLFSKDSIIRWILIKSRHMDSTINQLIDSFTKGGS